MDRIASKFNFTRALKRKKPEHPQLDDSREYPSSSPIVFLKRRLKTCQAYSRRLEKRFNHISKIHREDRAALEYERKMRHAAEEQLAMSPGVAVIQQAEAKWTALCNEQSTLQNKLSLAESQLLRVPRAFHCVLEEILREVVRITGSPEEGVFEHFRHFADCSLLSESECDDMDVEVPVVQQPPTLLPVVLQPVPIPQVAFCPQPQPQCQPPPPHQAQFEPHPQFQPHHQFQPQPQPQLQRQPEEQPLYHPQPQFEFLPQQQHQFHPQPDEQPLYHPQPPFEFQPRPQQQHQPEPQVACLQPDPNAYPASHPDNSSPPPAVPLPTPAPSPGPTFTHPAPLLQVQTEDYFSQAPLWSVLGAGDDANFDCARTEDNTSDEEDGEDDSDTDEEDSDDEDDDDDEDRPIHHQPSNTSHSRRVDLSIRMPKQTQPMPPGVGDTSGLPTP